MDSLPASSSSISTDQQLTDWHQFVRYILTEGRSESRESVELNLSDDDAVQAALAQVDENKFIQLTKQYLEEKGSKQAVQAGYETLSQMPMDGTWLVTTSAGQKFKANIEKFAHH